MMERSKRIIYAMLVLTLFLTVFSGCKKTFKEKTNLEVERISFRDIPGITQNEITAIENLRKKHSYFVYGVTPNSEAFKGKSGEIEGYAATFCSWLSEMFGIQFKPVYYQWGDLLRGLESHEVDFTGELMSSSDYVTNYIMTSPTINRKIKFYQIIDSIPIDGIIRMRTPRYAFLRGSVVFGDINANTDYDFEKIFVDNHKEAYSLLKSGKVDAFFGMDTAEGAFDEYGDVIGEDIYPLIFRSSCLTTLNEELRPVINVLEKAMNNNVLEYLTELQKRGHDQYLENKLYTLMTKEELYYIKNNPVIQVGADFSNYPISFFNFHTGKWEGIYFEALGEIEKLTGFKFQIANDQNTPVLDMIDMVENGKAMIVPELFQIKEYEGRFLWSDVPIVSDNFAFVSRADFRNIDINDIFHLQVGLRKETIYSELFKKIFPAHTNYTEYDTQEKTWSALAQGDVDVIFTSRRRLTTYTNYYEDAGYKLSLVFNHTFNSYFGYNKDAVILKSIIDKALRIVNINNIANQWVYKTYDYRNKLASAQRPWLVGASVLFLFVLVLVSILFIRSRSVGKQLEKLVSQRTGALALETSKLKTVIDSIPDSMFCKDTELRYTQCNRIFEEFMGVNEKDILGKSDEEGAWLPQEQVERIHNIEKAVIENNQLQILEEKVRSSFTGKECYFETVKAPIWQDGVVVGLIAIVRDITRRKEMEEEVLAASKAKSAFLANMSHELRTPLNVVIGLTDLILEEESLDVHVTENLTKISSAGSTLLSIVNDILDFSKIESGKLSITPVKYYTSSLLNDIITLVTTRLGEKPVTFRLDINDDLPSELYGDDLRVKQILTNLLTNAVKYTKEGTIKLSVRCKCEDNKTVWMDASVSDTGMGIHEEDMKNLFVDYYQVINNISRNIEGTGLGLPITKRLVEMMDGELKVESDYGKGSTFSIRLKQGFVGDKPLGPDIAEKLRNFCYADTKRTVTKKLVRLNLDYAKVLVVDDMQTNLDVAAGLLRKYKMQVDCLSSGQEAIERIRKGTPVYNAIFMDHMMPVMDGIEAAGGIRALGTEYAKKIPIIALTANAIQGTEKMFYEHGFQAFISKPIDVVEMDTVIRKWVRNDSRENAPVAKKPVIIHDSPAVKADSEGEDLVIEIPGVDTKKGLSLYAGEMDIYLPLLRSYAANTPTVLEKLKAVSAENLTNYVITVHGLKGTSAGIGAEAIREAALELENKSRAGDLQGVLAKNDKLINDTEVIVANVKAWLEQYDASREKKPLHKTPDKEVLKRLKKSCDNFNMKGIDEAIAELESADYEEGGELVAWLREKIDISEIKEIADRLAKEEL